MVELDVTPGARDGREERIRSAVLRLAEAPPSAEEAKRRPATPGLAENLVFEFDEAYTGFVEGFVALPSEAQLPALQAVDTAVAAMVGAKEAALWTEAARREDPRWIDLRARSQALADAFGWSTR